MVAGGLMRKCSNSGAMTLAHPTSAQESHMHAVKVVAFARAMLREAQKVLLPTTGKPLQIRRVFVWHLKTLYAGWEVASWGRV